MRSALNIMLERLIKLHTLNPRAVRQGKWMRSRPVRSERRKALAENRECLRPTSVFQLARVRLAQIRAIADGIG